MPLFSAKFRKPSAALAALALFALALSSCATTFEEQVLILSGKDEDADFEDMLDAAVALGDEAERIVRASDAGEKGVLAMIRSRLAESLAKADHPLVRAACARALLRAASPKAAALMVQALDDVSPLVRSEAVRGIGNLRHFAACARLADMLLADPEVEVRCECARQLGRMRAAAHVESLVKAMSDRDQTVRAGTEKSLNEITCRDLGDSAEDWQAWFDDYRKRTSPQGGLPR